MRLRNIPGAREAIALSPWVIEKPEEHRGLWRTLFKCQKTTGQLLHLEIGTGKGRFIMEMAQRCPDILFIGIEKYSSVLLRCLEKQEELQLENLLFIRGDAELINTYFEDGEIDKIYLNFSDPWPKERHARRRLPSSDYLRRYDRILSEGGSIEFKTDNRALFDFAVEETVQSAFKITRITYDLHNDPSMNEGNIMTEYEEKFSKKGNKICKYILCRKKDLETDRGHDKNEKEKKSPAALCGISLLLCLILLFSPVTALAKEKGISYKSIFAPEGYEDYEAERKANMAQSILTNKVPSWPEGPAVGAAGAIVMDADSGTVLYAKNIDMRLYPASITKLMTGLLAYENLKPTDMVTFSENAVYGIEPGSSSIGMKVGDSITVEQALYGLMLASANEVAVALGERVSGTEKEFVRLMNERAAQLGCKNTHFVTTNGLHDLDHYTSAYDMALIAREMTKYPELMKYMSENVYAFEATDTQPRNFEVYNTNKFIIKEIENKYVYAGKTGYTDESRQTLVTFAKRKKQNLICVILREERPYQYYDTADLLNYAFKNFKRISLNDREDRFQVLPSNFLMMGPDIFGRIEPIGSLPENSSVTIPKNTSFENLKAEITPFSKSAEKSEKEQTILGVIHYTFNGYEVGTADVSFLSSGREGKTTKELHGLSSFLFSLAHIGFGGSVYMNTLLLVPLIFLLTFLLTVIFFFHSAISLKRKRRINKIRRQRARRQNRQE